jgi:hypothetical protein
MALLASRNGERSRKLSPCARFLGTSVFDWTVALAPGGFLRCVSKGSNNVMERTTNNRSLGSNAFAFDGARRNPQRTPFGSSKDFSADDSPLFLTDRQPDPREFAPLLANEWTSILARFVAGGLVVAGLAILVAVFHSDGTRVLIDKAMVSIERAIRSETQSSSNKPTARQMLPTDDPADASDPLTRTTVGTSAPRLGTASHENIVNDYRAAQSQVPAARTGNEGAAPSKTLDPETLAALMTRAKGLLALGDFAAARLLLERAANARDPTAAFLLAQTYDPVVLRARDTRSITPNPVMARDWYRKAASFGSAEAQQRLTQLHN